MVLSGNELRFYRKETDKEHKLMHCLTGTYLQILTMKELSGRERKKPKSKSSSSTMISQNTSAGTYETKNITSAQ